MNQGFFSVSGFIARHDERRCLKLISREYP